MTLRIAIFTVVIINSLNLHIVALHKLFQLLIFLPIQNLFDLFNTFVQLFIVIGNNDDMQRLIILEYVFGLFVGSSTPHPYFASWALFDEFLGSATLTYDFTYVVGFGVVDGIFWQENLFKFFEGFVIIGRNESRMIE